MASRAWILRATALLGAGSFAVHQARYALGYRGDASDALAAQGHSYLVLLGPLLVGALLPVVAGLVHRAARGTAAPLPRFAVLWAAFAAGILFVYCVQESVEGALSSGHPAGVAAVLAHGGWIALPLSLVAGLVIALVLRGARAAGGLAPPRRPWRPPLPVAPRLVRAAARPTGERAAVQFTRGARGPPLLSV